MTRSPLARVALLALALTSGCGERSSKPGDRVLRADSAGFTIVTSTAPSWSDATAWRLDTTPAVEIGGLDDRVEYQLYRAVDAGRLSDGRIVVANAGTSEIRYYDASGRFLAGSGGEGDGPGEYAMIGSLDVLPGDSIVVWDVRRRQLSVIDDSGRFARSFALARSGEGSIAEYRGRFGDGSLLVAAPTFAAEPVDFELVGADLLYLRYQADGSRGDTLGLFGTSRSIVRTTDDGGFFVFRVPFYPAVSLAPGRTHLYAADARGYEIRVLGGSARPLLIRRAFKPIAVSGDLLERRLTEDRAGIESAAILRLAREAAESMPVPEFVPAVDRVLVDAEGHLWARQYQLPRDTVQTWSVFSITGVWLGEIDVPIGVEVLQIAEAVLVGRTENELGVEQIVVYDIRKP